MVVMSARHGVLARTLEVPFRIHDVAGAGWGLDRGREADGLTDGHVGTVATVDGQLDDRLDALPAAASGGTTTWLSTIS